MIVTCPACGRKLAATAETSEVSCECGHAFDPAARPTVADRFLGRELPGGYRIDDVIGSGGMGTVYKATQLSLRRPVAVKVLPEQVADDPQFVERFHREAEVLAALSHPNIVQVFDRGEVDGRYFIVMEYVDGECLRDLMRRGPIPAKQACRIAAGLLNALDYAHDRGVVHRDIKPENVLVSHAGGVKIADFGLSRVLGGDELASRLTRTHLVLGTYEYMAPEQREQSGEADSRADIYSTAVVFYEMLTGELPIGRFDLPSRRVPSVDRRVDRIVGCGLAKDPARRYERAGAMGREIESLLTTPEAPVDLAALKRVATGACRRVEGVMRRRPPEVRPPSGFEMRLDLLLTILAVCGMALTITGFGLMVSGERLKLPLFELDDDAAGLVVMLYGMLLWSAAERARKYWPGARTMLLTLTLLAAPTVLALPLVLWTWATFLEPRMRIYYASRYRGLDGIRAASVAHGLQPRPPRRGRGRSAAALARVARVLAVASAIGCVTWLFVALDRPPIAFKDEGLFFFVLALGSAALSFLFRWLAAATSKNL